MSTPYIVGLEQYQAIIAIARIAIFVVSIFEKISISVFVKKLYLILYLNEYIFY